MALVPFPISMTACVLCFLVLQKVLTLLMIGSNIFGLPDYVLGEILSSSSGVLSKEHRPLDVASGAQRNQRSPIRTASSTGTAAGGGGGGGDDMDMDEYPVPEPPPRLLRIGKDAPGLTSMLTLDLTDKHLTASCKRRKQQPSSSSASAGSAAPGTGASSSAHESLLLSDSQLTFQKEFSLVNLGQEPVTVTGFLIGPHVGVSSSSYKSKSTLASLSDEPIGSNSLLSSLIGQLHCQGFGFRVLNCGVARPPAAPHAGSGHDKDHGDGKDTQAGAGSSSTFEPFVLQPNASHKIRIAFTPDFTIAKSLATLTVVMDDGPMVRPVHKDWMQVLGEHLLPSRAAIASARHWLSLLSPLTPAPPTPDPVNLTSDERTSPASPEPGSGACPGSGGRTQSFDAGLHLITYSLIATVPKNLLSVCERSLPRPYQEMILYYTLVVFMICLVVATCTYAFIDGTRVLNFSFYPAVLTNRQPGPADHAARAMHSFTPFDLKSCEQASTASNGAAGLSKQQQMPGRESGGWTSFLKSRLGTGRRGSTGSATSSVSGDGSSSKAGTSSGTNASCKSGCRKGGGKKNSAKGSTAEEAAVSSLRRRLNAQSWFDALSHRNREEQREAVKIPLPTFEAVFDDEDIQNLRGQKGKGRGGKNSESCGGGGKKEKEGPPASSSSPSTSSTGTSHASGSSSPTTMPHQQSALSPPAIVTNGLSAGSGHQVPREQSVSARASPRTVLSSTTSSSSGIGSSFELPYNPGKGRRSESMSAVPSDSSSSSSSVTVLFAHNDSFKESPASDFGFWDPADSASAAATGSRSSIDNSMEIWDTVTMFDAQKAMLDLKNKKKQQQNHQSAVHRNQKQDSSAAAAAAASKSALCGFGSSSLADTGTNGSSFPAVGLFDASLAPRQVHTPSPRGWSPSHKSLTASLSGPGDVYVGGAGAGPVPLNGYPNQRMTPSPIGLVAGVSGNGGGQAMTWDMGEKDGLSRLRESSTEWQRVPGARVTTPVQRPVQAPVSSMWPDIAPGGGRSTDKGCAFWPPPASTCSPQPVGREAPLLTGLSESTPVNQSSSSPSSSWNPLSGGSNGFSLFGRSLWSPIPVLAPPPGMAPITPQQQQHLSSLPHSPLDRSAGSGMWDTTRVVDDADDHRT